MWKQNRNILRKTSILLTRKRLYLHKLRIEFLILDQLIDLLLHQKFVGKCNDIQNTHDRAPFDDGRAMSMALRLFEICQMLALVINAEIKPMMMIGKI